MAKAILSWSDDASPVEVASGEQLREMLRLLNEKHCDPPITALVQLQSGASLYIGVGRDESAVVIHEPIEGSQWTVEWTSIGNPEREGEIDFWLFGHHTPHLAASCLPLPTAIDCAVEYFETRTCSRAVGWDEGRF